MNNGHSPPKTADIVIFGSGRDGRIDRISPAVPEGMSTGWAKGRAS